MPEFPGGMSALMDFIRKNLHYDKTLVPETIGIPRVIVQFVIDEEGNIKFLVVGISTGKFSFFGSKEYVEIPWECVTKVGTNVIVISAEEGKIKRARA